jgi:hypothetical protein
MTRRLTPPLCDPVQSKNSNVSFYQKIQSGSCSLVGLPSSALSSILPLDVTSHSEVEGAMSWKKLWLLLDSRVVVLPRAYNPNFVMLSSLKPFFFNSLKNALCFSDKAGV